MDTNDDGEKAPIPNVPENKSTIDTEGPHFEVASIPGGVSTSTSELVEHGPFNTIVVRAQNSANDKYAELEVTYSWDATAQNFTCQAKRYRAGPGGRKGGNCYLRIISQGDSSFVELTRDNGQQDWTWHDISGALSVSSGGRDAQILHDWRFDVGIGGDVTLHGSVNLRYSPPPPVIGVIRNVINSTFTVSGSNGIPGFELDVFRNFDYVKARAVIQSNGNWTATPTLPASMNSMSIASDQRKGNVVSAQSNAFEVFRATITSPASNAIVTQAANDFSGKAAPGTIVVLTKPPPEHGVTFTEDVTTDASGAWVAKLKSGFASGTYSATALFKDAVRSAAFTFRVLGYPLITNTQLTVSQGFPLTGRNRLSGATVTAYIGPSYADVGTAPAGTTDTFSITTSNLDPGAHALTVEQFHSSKGSGRSVAVTFNVKPNPPTVTSTTTGERVKLHGTGFRGGELHFHQPGNGNTPLFSVPIKSDGTFEYDVPLTQLPGSLAYSCRQSVLGVAPARIYSDGWVVLQTTIPTPAPTSVRSSQNNHQLIISGSGHYWSASAASVVIFNNGVDMRPGVPAATMVPNLIWSIYSGVYFNPGTYDKLTAKMWVNSVFSSAVNVPPVTIPSPKPELTPITSPTNQRPQIKGTMWNGSKVEVRVNGGTAQLATTTGAGFLLDAASDWAPGTYTVSVTAEFGGQTSTPSTQSLTVRTPQPKILTTGPVPLIATVNGTGWPGCRVKIFTTVGNRELGAGDVKTDHTFEITLLKQAAGDQTLYAVQHESGAPANESIESDRAAVKFGVPTAAVTVPGEGGRTPRVSTFSGTTTANSGFVELWLGTTLLRNNIAITNGTWSASGIELDAGPRAVLVYMRDGSDLSAPTTRNVTVVPEKLKIDSPLTNHNLGHLVRVCGVGAFPGDQVIVRRLGTPLDFAPVTVNEHGQWTTNLQHNMVAGNTLAAIARASVGLDSDLSDSIIPKLLHAPQHFTQPQAGDRTGTKPVFAGLARPLAAVTIAHWFNNASILATTVADAHGYFEVQSTVALAEGGAWVQMRDTLGGQHSEWRKSERFEVKSVALNFPAPTLIYPVEEEKVSRRTIVSGRGLAGALVRVYRRGVGSDELGVFLVDRAGNWSGHLNKDIAPGPFVMSVRHSRDGFDSQWMVPDRTVEVVDVPSGFGTPIFLEPPPNTIPPLEIRPLFRGKGYPGAVVKVFEVPAFLGETIVNAQGNWSFRCAIDLAEQTDPHTVGARQYLGDHVSGWSSEVTQFTVSGRTLHPPIVVDPMDKDYVSSNPVIYLTAMPGSMVSLFPELTTNKIGTGFTDASGLCVIPLYDLPLGRYVVRGKTEKGGVVTGWMTPIELDVVDIG